MVSPLVAAAISFLGRLGALVFRVAGGRDVPRVASGNKIITKNINRALEIERHRSLAQRAANNFEKFGDKLDKVQDAHENWDDAKNNYESTLESISTYKRELIRARRARNQDNIDRYTELLRRANETKEKRKSIMDKKYNIFIDRLEELADIAAEVLEDKEELEGVLA